MSAAEHTRDERDNILRRVIEETADVLLDLARLLKSTAAAWAAEEET